MSFKELYFTRREIGKFQEHLFLRVPREAKLNDGVPALLGSLSEKGRGGGPGRGWPKPVPLGVSQRMLDELEERRDAIADFHGVQPDDLEWLNRTSLANTTLTLEKRHVLDLGLDADIPGLPVGASVGFNGTWLKQMTIQWGEGTVATELRKGHLFALYRLSGGDHRKIVPNGLLQRHFIVQSVISSRNYTITAHSERAFTAEFKAKVDEIAKAADSDKPGTASANATYTLSGKNTLSVKVDGDAPYLIGIAGVKWNQLDLGL